MLQRNMVTPPFPVLVLFLSLTMSSCSGGDSGPESPTPAIVENIEQPTFAREPTSKATAQDVGAHNADAPVYRDPTACLKAVTSTRDMDILEAELACPMTVSNKVRVKFVGTDETYGCTPYVVAVAPKDSPREYVRIAITHGTEKEFTGVVRLQNQVLSDRKSGWRTYGWPGNPPLTPCSELSMKVVSVTCKMSGAPSFEPCAPDIDILPVGLFLSEELLSPI